MWLVRRCRWRRPLLGALLFVVTAVQFVMRLETSDKRRPGTKGSRANYSIPEVEDFIGEFQARSIELDAPYHLDDLTPYRTFLQRLNALKKKGLEMGSFIQLNGTRPWEEFQRKVNQYYMYDPTDGTVLKDLLGDLNSRPIVRADRGLGNVQLILVLTFDNGGKAIFKPMRKPREHETPPNRFYYSDMERHNAEIAAFHLDMVLGFHRAVPTVGRLMNITRDIAAVGDQDVKQTVHVSPAGNVCFFSQCRQYCDVDHSVCGSPDVIEGSVSAYMPGRAVTHSKYERQYPWMRSYAYLNKTAWELNDSYCDLVVRPHPEFGGRRLLDFMDTAIFDFLIGNMDRHNYETFQHFGNDTFVLLYDHGRGFGKSKYDCTSCLAPLRQCCVVRQSTLTKLAKLYVGPSSLSQVLRRSMTSDPLSPILWEPHLDALDRRLGKVIRAVSDCIAAGKSWEHVIINDGVT